MSPRSALFWGCFHVFASVAAGAFGAHGLKELLSQELLDIFKTGTHYQMIHGLAMTVLGTLGLSHPTAYSKFTAICFCWGSTVFAFSLYALALTGIKFLGAITPIGGLLFLLGWGRWMVMIYSQSPKKTAVGGAK